VGVVSAAAVPSTRGRVRSILLDPSYPGWWKQISFREPNSTEGGGGYRVGKGGGAAVAILE
jgi:hypothetical protein